MATEAGYLQRLTAAKHVVNAAAAPQLEDRSAATVASDSSAAKHETETATPAATPMLQLMQGGGMQLLTFKLQQDVGKESDPAVLSAGGAANAAAGGVAAVATSQTSVLVATAAAVADGSSRTAAGPVCEAVEEEDRSSMQGAPTAQAWSAPAATSASGGLPTSSGGAVETSLGARSSVQPLVSCNVLRSSSAGDAACGSAEVDVGSVKITVQDRQIQQPPQPALQELGSVAQAAAAAGSATDGTAASFQTARLLVDVHAEPGADTLPSSVTSCRATLCKEQQRGQQQHQQRKVLQQLLTDEYLRGWEGEGSQGTQLLPTVAAFRPLACATQVGCTV
jgi:hypothetical protein